MKPIEVDSLEYLPSAYKTKSPVCPRHKKRYRITQSTPATLHNDLHRRTVYRQYANSRPIPPEGDYRPYSSTTIQTSASREA